MLCTHNTTTSASLDYCHKLTNPYLHQFSSISGGNCIIEPAAVHVLLFLKIHRCDEMPWSVFACSSAANTTLMTSSSTTTSSLKRQVAVSRSSTCRSSTSRSANVVAIAATVGIGSSDVGTVWTFICPMSLLSTVVTDVVRFVMLLFPLELLDEGIELCLGEGARRGLRILQVACWTPSLVAK